MNNVFLAVNAWHLARYVIEHDHKIQIPKEVNIGKFLCWSEDYPHIESKEDKIEFINSTLFLKKVRRM